MKQPDIKFSIITVVFNAAQILEKTILSVISQTYRFIEYIIIDGGSNDGTVSVIRRYQGGVKYWISEPDEGLYDAMNKGLQAATGDYVCFLNAGDRFQHHRIIAELAAIAERENTPDILYGETNLIDATGRVFARRRLKAPRRLTWKSFRMGMVVCHQAFIVKRSLAPEYDRQYRFSADFDWCIRCLKTAYTIVNTRLRLVYYLYEGATTANRKASLKERYDIMCQYYGKRPTQIRHIWFAIRFYWAKIFRNNS